MNVLQDLLNTIANRRDIFAIAIVVVIDLDLDLNWPSYASTISDYVYDNDNRFAIASLTTSIRQLWDLFS